MSLKKVVCKDRASRNGMQCENTSDASSVHLSSWFCSYLGHSCAYTFFPHQNINFNKHQCDF